MDGKRTNDASSSTATTTRPGSLLKSLRKNVRSDEQIKQEMLQHRSEFPSKIRDLIREKEAENPSDFCYQMEDKLTTMIKWRPKETEKPRTESTSSATAIAAATESWGGFDISVDTPAEFEILLRLFPSVLTDGVEMNDIEVFAIPVDMAWSPKTIPFLPVFCRVGKELLKHFIMEQDTFERVVQCIVEELVQNWIPLESKQLDDDEESWRRMQQLNEATLTALQGIKDSGVLMKRYMCDFTRDIIDEKESWNVDRLRFLIEWNPLVLKGGFAAESLFRVLLCNSKKLVDAFHDDGWPLMFVRRRLIKVFELLFEAGMVHYPQEMGFLFDATEFHSDDSDTDDSDSDDSDSEYSDTDDSDSDDGFYGVVHTLCNLLSRDEVFKMVEMVLLKHVMENSETYERAVLGAATDDNILLDALYVLVRADPSKLCDLVVDKNETNPGTI